MIYSKQKQIGKRKKPKQKERTKITKKDYNRAIEVWGEYCFCGRPMEHMHHIVYRSQMGKSNYRNLIPLCEKHHRLAHSDNDLRRRLEIQRRRMFGEFYWCDKYDLHEKGIIAEPTEELLEAYFREVVWEKSQ